MADYLFREKRRRTLTPPEESRKRKRLEFSPYNILYDDCAGALYDDMPVFFFSIKSRSSCDLVSAIAMGMQTLWEDETDVVESVLFWLDPHAEIYTYLSR